MRSRFVFLSVLTFCCWSSVSYAADLVEVLQQAVRSDPAFSAAQAQRMAAQLDIPIAASYLLPYVDVVGSVSQTVQDSDSSPLVQSQFSNLGRGVFKYRTDMLQLNLQQALFNVQAWQQFQQAKTVVKQADATYLAAAQDLIARTAFAYFNVLDAEDNLRYVEAEKQAVYEQLDQVTQQFKVGVVAITGVYQAQAQYDLIVAQEISAKNAIVNTKEDLRAITGVYYENLAVLKELIPLQIPEPNDPEKWVKSATQYNWTVLAARYAAEVAEEEISVIRAGHLPTLTAVGLHEHTLTGVTPTGKLDETSSTIGVQLDLPVFEGGLIVAQTRQAQYSYKQAYETAEQILQNTVTDTRKSYNDVASGISKIKADRKAIISNASSLRSTIEGYRVGTQTMLDILQSQQYLFDAQRIYSQDEYAYIDAVIALKQDAGTLSFNDIAQINTWLTKTKRSYNAARAEQMVEDSKSLLKQLQAMDQTKLLQKTAEKQALAASAAANKQANPG